MLLGVRLFTLQGNCVCMAHVWLNQFFYVYQNCFDRSNSTTRLINVVSANLDFVAP